MNDFNLEKWYMDAADEKGNAFIGYSASLRWKLMRLSYNGFTFSSGSTSSILSRNSFSSRRLPEVSEEEVKWSLLEAKGHWKRNAGSLQEVLLCSPVGDITWSCVFPQALATIHIGDDSMEENVRGYVEKISISIHPWRIPIHELFWGRFLSPDHTIVWIRWIGPVPKILIYHNGTRLEKGLITTENIIFDDYSLELHDSRILRRGSLFSTVFSKFPLISKLFPSAIMQMQENKWVSRGVLRLRDMAIAGRVIHEHVTWR